MRRIFTTVLLALPLAAFAATPQTIVLDVNNMTCSMCSITIKKALQKVPGVQATTIDYDKKTATVTYDPDKASPAGLVKATSDAGFPSRLHEGSKP